MIFHIRTHHDSTGTLFLDHSIVKQYSLPSSGVINLKIGAWEKDTTFKAHSAEDPSLVYLSADIADDVQLPEHLPFELMIDQQQIQIGPVVGILISGRTEELGPRSLRGYLKYAASYQQVRGLVLLFTVDGMDDREKKVQGFAYNPETNSWEKGTYAFPSAVFCRRRTGSKLQKRFSSLIEERFFNSLIFDKWEMWERLSQYEDVRSYLPDTGLAAQKNEVKRFIDKYRTVFLKPMAGMQGSGVYRLEQQQSSYIFQYERSGQSMHSTAHNWEDAYAFMKDEMRIRSYLVQQEIDLIRIDERVVDFRVILQKSKHGTWYVQGSIARHGRGNSVVSNISKGGNAEKAWKTLMTVYDQNAHIAFRKLKEMEELAVTACESLEMTGMHLGNIGMDIGLDRSGKLWIIEINNREPDMTIALDAGDKELYYRLKSTPLEYAKWLSGF